MRLVLHHAMKDVRLLRGILVVWLLLNVALHAVVLYAAAAPVPESGIASGSEVAYYVLQALNLAGFVAIAAIVIQNDPAMATTAFWVTRPVSVGQLLGAKFLVLVLALVLLPVVTDFLSLVAAGVGTGRALAVVPGAIALQFAWLLPIAAVAAVTTTLPAFVVAGVAEIVGYMLLVIAITTLVGPERVPRDAVRVVAVAAVLAVLSVVVLVSAYRWRHLRRAIVLAAVVPLVLALLFTQLPAIVRAASALPPASADPGPFRTVELRLEVGARYQAGGTSGEVIAVKSEPEHADVVIRRVGRVPLQERSYALRHPRRSDVVPAATLISGGPSQFLSMLIPVPQHLSVSVTIVRFQWPDGVDTDPATWLREARLVVQ